MTSSMTIAVDLAKTVPKSAIAMKARPTTDAEAGCRPIYRLRADRAGATQAEDDKNRWICGAIAHFSVTGT